MRVLGTNVGQTSYGVFTSKPEALTNDFFVNMLDMNTKWPPESDARETFGGHDRTTGAPRWKAPGVDLVFGSNAQLRALAEVYGCEDGRLQFVRDFVAAWTKVMN